MPPSEISPPYVQGRLTGGAVSRPVRQNIPSDQDSTGASLLCGSSLHFMSQCVLKDSSVSKNTTYNATCLRRHQACSPRHRSANYITLQSHFGADDSPDGTMIPITFTRDVLFPSALKALPAVLESQWTSPEFQQYRSPFPASAQASPKAFEAHVGELTEQNSKATYFKDLQGT
jgi:hypothetical protein